MRDVVVRHRQDRQLRDAAAPALDAARALVDGREVGVHVARVAAPAGHLLARGAHLFWFLLFVVVVFCGGLWWKGGCLGF